MKKSNEKSAIPKWQVETLLDRKRAAEQHYRENYVGLRKEFLDRLELRRQKLQSRKGD
jgi:hypothetical protein